MTCLLYTSDILGTARKAELFDELLKTFEEFMEDEDFMKFCAV